MAVVMMALQAGLTKRGGGVCSGSRFRRDVCLNGCNHTCIMSVTDCHQRARRLHVLGSDGANDLRKCNKRRRDVVTLENDATQATIVGSSSCCCCVWGFATSQLALYMAIVCQHHTRLVARPARSQAMGHCRTAIVHRPSAPPCRHGYSQAQGSASTAYDANFLRVVSCL